MVLVLLPANHPSALSVPLINRIRKESKDEKSHGSATQRVSQSGKPGGKKCPLFVYFRGFSMC